MKFSLLLLITLIVGLPVMAKVLPVEYFANLPDVRSLSLSPDGEKLAAIIRIDFGDENGSAIQVTSIKTGKKMWFSLVIILSSS